MKSTEFKQFSVEWNVDGGYGRYQHVLIPELQGVFTVIESPNCKGFFQWELDTWDGLCYIPDEVVAVLVSWQIYVPIEATL